MNNSRESSQVNDEITNSLNRQKALIQAACRQVEEQTTTDWAGSFLSLGEAKQPVAATEIVKSPHDFRVERSGADAALRRIAIEKQVTPTRTTHYSAGERVGPYNLIQFLGKGAFGEVWLAERTSAVASTRLAVKLPITDNSDLSAVRREAELWVRAAHHPNVLPIFEADVYDNQLVIVSEYAPDGTLENWLKRLEGISLSCVAAVDMTMGLLSGLEHLHVRGIVHRDLKPTNVLMQGDFPRIADFGLARLLESPSKSSQIAGTPAYMAPESFDGIYSQSSDLWAVGVILYRLLSGHMPFAGDRFMETKYAVVHNAPRALPSSVSPWIQKVVAIALEKDVQRRFSSAADMRSALRDALRRLDAEDLPIGFVPQIGCRTIAVTGSMGADSRKVASLIQALAAPYCGSQTTWYCGTVGVVDEVAATFLLEKDQRVIAVGYHTTDLSPVMATILRHNFVPFVDASNEPVPSSPDAPSQRDIYFATKADLVIVIWDGKSRGTRMLIEWLHHVGKDHILGFVHSLAVQ